MSDNVPVEQPVELERRFNQVWNHSQAQHREILELQAQIAAVKAICDDDAPWDIRVHGWAQARTLIRQALDDTAPADSPLSLHVEWVKFPSDQYEWHASEPEIIPAPQAPEIPRRRMWRGP